jgi:hypothetical protein
MAPGVSRAPCAEARCPSPRVGNAAIATSLRVVSPSRFGSRQRACDPSFRRLTPSERAGVRGLRRLWFERREHCENTARTLREHCENTARTLQEHCAVVRKNTKSTAKRQPDDNGPASHDISQDKPRHQSRQATTSVKTSHDISRHRRTSRIAPADLRTDPVASIASDPFAQPLPQDPCPRAAPSPTVIASSLRRTSCP